MYYKSLYHKSFIKPLGGGGGAIFSSPFEGAYRDRAYLRGVAYFS